MSKNRLWLIAVIPMLFAGTAVAQTFNLSVAESRGIEHYPITRQKLLTETSTRLQIENLNKNFLPQLSVGAQGTYQTAVTEVSIPNAPFKIEPPSKDQYKFTLDINQLIYDGGLNKEQKQMANLKAALENSKTDAELLRLKEKIDAVYCNILLSESMIAQQKLVKSDLETGIKKVNAQLKEGTAFKSSLNMLKAESLKVDQKMIEWKSNRYSFIQMLSILTDTSLDENCKFEAPAEDLNPSNDIQRPELRQFQQQLMLADKQKDLINAKLKPRASFFVQGGYGRPGLNMLQNSFDWFAIGGFKVNWNFGNLYTAANEKKLAETDRQNTEIQKEAFLLNVHTQMTQQEEEARKMLQLMQTDQEIISLRESVKNSAAAQLEAGVITAGDYLREVNALDMARQSFQVHQIQFLQTIILYKNITGQSK